MIAQDSMIANKVRVRVPATTANCGPGFDALGISCTLYNELELELTSNGQLLIEISGEGQDVIPVNEHNLAWQAIKLLFKTVQHKFTGARIAMQNNIPLARGLGSSAAAIVGALTAANALSGKRLDKQQLLMLATSLEGHPDNVAAAIYGGVAVSVIAEGEPRCLNFFPPAPLSLVVAIPEFRLATKMARQVLPATVPFKDAVFNVSRTALLIAALTQGQLDYLVYALDDRLHQPYRQQLIPGMDAVFTAGKTAGALGVTISGAGSCLMAYTERDPELIGQAMVTAFNKHNVQARYRVLNIDRDGAKIIES